MNTDIYLVIRALTEAYKDCKYALPPCFRFSYKKDVEGLSARNFVQIGLRFCTYSEFLADVKEKFRNNAEILLNSELEENFYRHIDPLLFKSICADFEVE